jgi:hypothetical protein
MYLYLDESGDLGFNLEKNKSSKKFVITILLCFTDNARREFRKTVQRTLKNKINKTRKNKKFKS